MVAPAVDTRFYANLSGPAQQAQAVTASDSTLLQAPTRALYIGGAGDVAVTTQFGDVVTFSAVPVGTLLPIRATKVMATNTTATLILALW